jgi:hypothetical protein
MSAVSTEGRVFVAQLTRDLAACEAAGAALLMPGCKRWQEAFESFVTSVSKCNGPVKAAAAFRAGIVRCGQAQKGTACFINSHMTRSRSGGFELLTWEVGEHPLLKTGNAGIIVYGYFCTLQRTGCVRVGRTRLAFFSWHALARIRERSKFDLFDARGLVVGCGVTGLVMRESDKHANTGMHYAAEGLICAGVLRVELHSHAFYDVVTVLPREEGRHDKAWAQGCHLSHIVHDYLLSSDADPKGLGDEVDVLPPRDDDYVSRELKKVG